MRTNKNTLAAKKKTATGAQAWHYDVIVSPVVTEKSTAVSEFNKVIFNVRLEATKPQIKSAVEALFNVKVVSVNTLVREGKTRRFRNVLGKKSDSKKAIITLAPGQSVDISAGVK
jgi:large subunit ribosomal protein L23